MKMVPVILAGGAGTRLWPLSNEDRPKQFHDLFGQGTLLNATLKRLQPLNPDICIIATSKKYEEITRKEIKDYHQAWTILAEPSPKNTAPAVLYTAIYISKVFNDSVMIVLPADHYIKKNDVFIKAMKAAIEEAKKDYLVTIGIKPEYPETGYGYIKACEGPGRSLSVENFVEKPDRDKAEKFLKEGNYFWNAGIFIWKTSIILSCFKDLMPDLYNAFSPLMDLKHDELVSNEGDACRLKEKVFASIDAVSIDYGIMEKAANKLVIPADIGWSDLGTWASMDNSLSADENNNRTNNQSDSFFLSTNNSSIFSEGSRIALIGLDNLIVAESGNNILVMNKNNTQEVKELVELINKRKKEYS